MKQVAVKLVRHKNWKGSTKSRVFMTCLEFHKEKTCCVTHSVSRHVNVLSTD